MKRNDSPSRRPFNPTESEPDFLGPIAPVAAPAFPSFPSVDELLQHQAGMAIHPLLQLTETAPPSKPASLFEGLLGGNLTALTQDLAVSPERYDAPTTAFLEELSSGAKKLEALTPRERALLDSAVMDFAAFRPPRTATLAPKKLPAPKEKKPALLREESELLDERAAQVDMPDGMPAYWWV